MEDLQLSKGQSSGFKVLRVMQTSVFKVQSVRLQHLKSNYKGQSSVVESLHSRSQGLNVQCMEIQHLF